MIDQPRGRTLSAKPTYRAISDSSEFPIQPQHIDTSDVFHGAFDHLETEEAARVIVRMCQKFGGWYPFSSNELDAFCQHNGDAGHRHFHFHRLMEPQPGWSRGEARLFGTGGFLVKSEEDGRLRVTEEFVIRCHKASPAKKKEE
jgi:hypothetical protein